MENEQRSNEICEAGNLFEAVHNIDNVSGKVHVANNITNDDITKAEEEFKGDEGVRSCKENCSEHSNFSTSDFPCRPAPPLEVKLFVGRIPRTHTEDEIKPLFEKYGKVIGVNIIRDKNNSTHKGSAFVRMSCLAQADAAVRALNNQKNLDESLGPLQVKYATGEAEKLGISDATGEAGLDQAKLFIGSIPKSMTEKEVKEFFSPYGQVDEIYIMKDSSNGSGKGCAFVKYAFKEQAIHAVKSLDRKHTFDGCSRPIEVRFAESRTQRQQAQQQQTPTSSVPTPAAVMPSLLSASGVVGVPSGVVGVPSGVVGVPQGAVRPAFPAAGIPTAYTIPTFTQIASAIPPAAASLPRQAGLWKEYFNTDGRAYYHNEATNVTQWEKPPEFDQQAAAPAQTMILNTAASIPNAAAYFAAATNPTATALPVGFATVSQAIGAGPPGANIFAFHVPPEWTQADLIAVFSPFGKIISARIATDNACDNKTKGYAFISYDNCLSAVAAVCHMNGFVWGSKKLKVTIKKGEEHVVQHLLPASFGGTATGNAAELVCAASTAALASAAGGLFAVQPATVATTGTLGALSTAAAATGQVAVAGGTAAASAAAPVAGYTVCNGTPLINQSGLAQYNLQAAAVAAQYGAYGLARYTPY